MPDPNSISPTHPPLLIVMGVSGSGKSFLGEKLAEVTGWPFAEGDDYHSEINKTRMHAGIPLSDADRQPWLDSLHAVLQGWQQHRQSGILSCSSLKKNYRARLNQGLPELRYVWLDPPRKVLEERMANRPGHFMPAALLDSQLATLEPPTGESNTLRLDGLDSPDRSVQTVLAWLRDQESAD